MRSLLPLLLALTACAHQPPHAEDSQDLIRTLPAYKDRDYLVHTPANWDHSTRLPVVLVLHGGGGNAKNAARLTCKDGDVTSPTCLNVLADKEHFLVVYPNGTGAALAPNARTWNAGGGTGEWRCVSGPACKKGVDDLAYFRALLDDLAQHFAIDEKRIYATGLSNGGAMSHRLACELSDRIAAVAPVSGGNQLAVAQKCEPGRAVPILEIHGTEDPCWAFNGGTGACLQRDGATYVSIPETISGWAKRNGCSATPTTEALPDSADDGTHASIDRYPNCSADVAFIKVEGGGHGWPGGFSYFSPDMIGRTSRDFSANQLIWDFFKAHPRP